MKHSYFLNISILVFFAVAVFLQLLLPLRGDVGYLLYITNQMLAGGTYGNEFFETNPPMILYLYAPVVLAAKILPLSLTALFRVYAFGLSALSIYICYFLAKKMTENKVTHYALLYGIMFALLILPSSQFGQREHLFLILVLPYLLLMACLLTNVKIQPGLLIAISLAAGLGFCIKPYFLFVFIMVNLFIAIHKKSILACFNMPNTLIVLTGSLYLVSTYLFFPTYFSIILPLVNRFYFNGIKQPWIFLFINPMAIFSIGVLCAYFVFRGLKKQRILDDLLAFALIGAMLAFIVTRTSWFYHTLPALSLACILLTLFLSMFISSEFKPRHLFFNLLAVLLVFTLAFNIVIKEINGGKTSQDLREISTYIAQSPGKHSVSCFSVYTTTDCFPLVYDTNSSYGSRYPFLWWMRGLVFYPNKQGYQLLSNEVARDLNDHKPRWVIIDNWAPKIYFGKDFDCIAFLSGNNKFKKAWEPYQLTKTEGHYAVYERRPALS